MGWGGGGGVDGSRVLFGALARHMGYLCSTLSILVGKQSHYLLSLSLSVLIVLVHYKQFKYKYEYYFITRLNIFKSIQLRRKCLIMD